MAAASREDDRLSKYEYAGALAGVTVAIKDVIMTKHLRSTCGSRILEIYFPP
jgi:aspartyl-tRNA(Asn)/glutamyl-tRNA(Gln) amidotransferase subunit A